MKKTIFGLCLLITAIFSLNTYSQSNENEKYNLELGGYLMLPKFFYNVDNRAYSWIFYDGIVDFGLSAFYPLNKNKDIAVLLEVCYANYAFRDDGSNIRLNDSEYVRILDPDYNYNTTFFNTINISPQIYLKGFTIGFDFGFFFPPDLINVSPSFRYDYNYELQYPYLVNLKIGGIIPIYKTELGTLNILAKATTSLSYIGRSQIGFFDNIGDDSFYLKIFYDKIQIVSASVGLNYMFNIPRRQK